MKYSAILDHVYGGEETHRVEELNLEPARMMAWRVVRHFYRLNGFDDWWDNIDDDTRDEIFEGLVEALK